jgi:hypothetical protein
VTSKLSQDGRREGRKKLLTTQVPPSEADRKAVSRGREEYTNGETEEWSEVRKRVSRLMIASCYPDQAGGQGP